MKRSRNFHLVEAPGKNEKLLPVVMNSVQDQQGKITKYAFQRTESNACPRPKSSPFLVRHPHLGPGGRVKPQMRRQPGDLRHPRLNSFPQERHGRSPTKNENTGGSSFFSGNTQESGKVSLGFHLRPQKKVVSKKDTPIVGPFSVQT